jgi:hypothetical protein
VAKRRNAFKVSVLYPNGTDIRFDMEYYCNRHIPMVYLLFGYIVAMLANVFIPHIPASFVFRSYTPGVVTAVLINLPVMGFLSIRAARKGWVSGGKAVVFGVAVPLAIAGIIPMLFLIH